MFDMLFGLINADPIISGVIKAVVVFAGIFVGVLAWRHRYAMLERVAPVTDWMRRVWLLWSPLLQSRTVVSGLIMYAAWRADKALPQEAIGALAEVVVGIVGSLALVGVVIGRMHAKGEIRLNREGLLSPGAQQELNASHAASRELSDFIRGHADLALDEITRRPGPMFAPPPQYDMQKGPWSVSLSPEAAAELGGDAPKIATAIDALADKELGSRAKRQPKRRAAKKSPARKRA